MQLLSGSAVFYRAKNLKKGALAKNYQINFRPFCSFLSTMAAMRKDAAKNLSSLQKKMFQLSK